MKKVLHLAFVGGSSMERDWKDEYNFVLINNRLTPTILLDEGNTIVNMNNVLWVGVREYLEPGDEGFEESYKRMTGKPWAGVSE